MLPEDRLIQITQRFEFLEAKLNAGPAPDEIAAISREYADLRPVVTQIAEWRAARDGLAAALKSSSANDGAMGVIGNFLRVQTGARSVEPREGSDPDAVLSRADAAVKAGDIAGALEQIGALPQPGQDAMSGWVAQARTWVEANAALSALAAGSM